MARPKTAAAADTDGPRDANDTRLQLLDVAERCFERWGIHRTTMEDVAVEARVSRPTLYRYFGDRDTLINAVSTRRAERFAKRLKSLFAKYETFDERLIEGMLDLGRIGAKDPFYSSLITPATVGEANRLLMAPDSAHAFAEEVWGPVLDEADAAGELREGLPRALAYEWLTSINILLIGSIENAGAVTDEHRELLREFLVPAFLKRSTGAQPASARRRQRRPRSAPPR